jgi:tetratricopeptide (TPR) repeat protein
MESQVGVVYAEAGDIGNALSHFQRSIQHCEAAGDVYKAGQTRHNVALLLANHGRRGEALHYARAAMDNFRDVGAGAASEAAYTQEFITALELREE